MFKLCVVGHGNYPDGVISALTLLAGGETNIVPFNLNQDLTHAAYEQQLGQFLAVNPQVLIFADMTGGAPHQIASRLILESKTSQHYIVSSAPLNLMLDLMMQIQLGVLTEANVVKQVISCIEMSKEMIVMLPDSTTEEAVELSVEEGI